MASRTGRAEPLPGTAGPPGRHGVQVLALPPGRELRPQTERWIVDGLVTAMPGLRARELFALRRDMLTEAEYLVVAVDPRRDAVVALLTSRWAPLPSGRPCLHVMTQFVGDAYRHGSVFGRSWAAHFARLLAEGRPFPEVIALKTYNPVVHCAMNAFASHPGCRLHPDLTGAGASLRPPRALLGEVAAAIAPGCPYDAERGVFPGVGRPVDLYRERPLSSVDAVNAHFGKHLEPGDRMLCVLHAPTAAGQHGILTALGLARPE
ncbi:hypothetical protein [Streptomyces sp. NPDC053079]|uniref:hypothetical protein n=1 Tax=Streptomyces sp. NPDC053079 TaxID=3365697 RepID=UPI0037D733A2